jgi:putative ABC transport system permease protein
MANDRWPYRVFGGLFLILAIISLMLSSVGLYAVMAYAVTQRTHEIGVRMAIGAQKNQIAWLVLKRGLWQVAIGMTLGIAGALGLGFVMADLLVDIQPSDPVTLMGVTVLLVAVSVLACLIPSRRAAQVDPVVALRVE